MSPEALSGQPSHSNLSNPHQTLCSQHRKIKPINSSLDNQFLQSQNYLKFQQFILPLSDIIYFNPPKHTNTQKITKYLPTKLSQDKQYVQESDSEEFVKTNDQPRQALHRQQVYPSEKVIDYFTLINQNMYQPMTENEPFSILTLKRLKENYYLINNLTKILAENHVKIIKQPISTPNIKINGIRGYADYEIIELDVSIGSLQKNIKIYNLLTSSCFHSLKPNNSGTFGNIYFWNHLGKDFAVKCVSKKSDKMIDLKYENVFEKEIFLREILKEYLITYIAGTIGLGPKVLNPLGFDLIISKNCIQFFLEQCETPDPSLPNWQNLVHQLKLSLYLLHLQNFVHNDIKPQNIMFSKISKKLVFIDFGLSEYLSRPIGFKKKTIFLGTYQYCSPEMQKLLLSNDEELLDLYYNDAYGLNQSIKSFLNFDFSWPQQKQTLSWISFMKENIDESINQIFLKYLFWNQDAKKAIEVGAFMNIKKKSELQFKLLGFIRTLPNLPDFQSFYNQFFSSNIQQIILTNKFNYHQKRFTSENDQEQENHPFYQYELFYAHLRRSMAQKDNDQKNFKQQLRLKAQKKLVLTTDDHSLPDQDLWSLFLDFINFLKINQKVSIEEKAQVSIFFIQKFKIKKKFCTSCQYPIPQILQPIFECLYYLLNKCFQFPLNLWKRNNFHQIIVTMVMMGWMIPKNTIITWKYFLISNSYKQEFTQKILQHFLKFQLIDQIYENRSFMFSNSKCLDEIEEKTSSLTAIQKSKSSPFSLYCFYKHQKDVEVKKIQVLELQELMIKVFELSEYPETNSQQNLDKMLNRIQNLNPSTFINSHVYNEVMRNLIFWIFTRYIKSLLSNDKLGKLIQASVFYEETKVSGKQIYVYLFQSIHMSISSNNIIKIRQFINYLDQVINCKIISDSFMIASKLLLFFEEGNLQKAEETFDKISKCTMNRREDSFLFKNLSAILHVIVFSPYGVNSNPSWIAYFKDNLEQKIHKFVCTFKQDQEMWKDSECRQNLSYIVIESVLVHPFRSETIHESGQAKNTKIKLIQEKLDSYLEILERVCCLYPEKLSVMKLIQAKIEFLGRRKRFTQLNQYLQKQKIFNFSDINSQEFNLHKIPIYVSYLSFKIKTDSCKLNHYREKMIVLFKQLQKNKSHFHIFMHIKIGECILKKQTSPQIIVQFLQSISIFVTLYPSRNNQELLMRYLIEMYKNFYQSDKRKSQPKISIDKYSPYFLIQSQSSTFSRPTELTKVFLQFDLKSYFDNIWNNPYIIMIAYLVAFECQIEVQQMRKLNAKIVKIMNLLTAFFRNIVLIKHFGFSLGDNRWLLRRKKESLSKKLIRATLNLGNLDQCVSVRLPPSNELEGFRLFKRGFELMKRKHKEYMENSEIRKKSILK